jgi:UDP-glucose 4-epimerase
MKILVTGHRGFIGKKIYDSLKNMSHDVVGVDLKDGKDLFYCLPDQEFDYVFHLAALPSVQFSVDNPHYSMRNNVLGTSKVLEWSKDHKVKRVIFSSSAAVNEGQPKSPYGLQKYISELECQLYSEIYDMDTVCLRYFNVYSEDQEFGGAYSTAIAAWIEMIKRGRPLRIDGDGEQTRDFIHVDDIVSANLFCMGFQDKFGGQHLNVATGNSVSLNYIKSYINSKYDVEWIRGPERKGDIRHSQANVKEILSLGWSPKISIIEGLNRCFKKEN